MAACDVLVHNAGGLSLSEALTAGLPAVTFAPIAGHGRANAALLHSAGLAPWATTTDELAECLRAAASRPRVPLTIPEHPAEDVVAGLARGAHRAAHRGERAFSPPSVRAAARFTVEPLSSDLHA